MSSFFNHLQQGDASKSVFVVLTGCCSISVEVHRCPAANAHVLPSNPAPQATAEAAAHERHSSLYEFETEFCCFTGT
jgi:hypothetical protein